MPAHRTLLLAALLVPVASAQTSNQTAQPPRPPAVAPTSGNAARAAADNSPAPPPHTPDHAQVLRGGYGPYRANNDLLYYHLDIRVDPVAKTISGKNTVRFKMLTAGNRIQLDLTDVLAVDKIMLGDESLKYVRDSGAVFIDFPKTLAAGQTYSIDFYYSGTPKSSGRFGGISFDTDPAGRPWIYTADEGNGSSVYWPSKDQWKDEPQEGMDISVAVPNPLTDVSNGRFVSKKDLGDGYTQWNWHVSYNINSYDVALNIGTYEHFSDTFTNPGFAPLTMDFYALPEDLDKAKAQFAQAKGMLEAYEHYFGEYPWARDGYKLIQVPYSGMEHQSAVAYGNGFKNGYGGGPLRDWTGVGISPKFDFIIIHESGHEWFGNSITAQDRSDMWIHEGWDTYLEALFVEFHYGKADALKYTSGFIPHVRNRQPIISERGAGVEPPQDMYFKAAMMIASLRSWINDDTKWFKDLHDFYQHFKYQNIMTDDVIGWWNQATGINLTAFFNEYLRHTAIPSLEVTYLPDPTTGATTHTVMYKWQADEDKFDMAIQVGDPAHWQTIHPTTAWQTMQTPLSLDDFKVATDLFYVNVSKN